MSISTVQTEGVHHLGLTVSNLQETQDFFTNILNYQIVGGRPEYPSVFLSDGHTMLTLWQAQCQTPTAFDRKNNIGLHHFAIKVPSKEQLFQLHENLKKHPFTEIEFDPEHLRGTPLTHFMCLIPGGIRVEFISA